MLHWDSLPENSKIKTVTGKQSHQTPHKRLAHLKSTPSEPDMQGHHSSQYVIPTVRVIGSHKHQWSGK